MLALYPLSRRQRGYLLAGGAAAVCTLAIYQVARSDAVAHTRRYFGRLRQALLKYADALSTGADTLNAVLLDLQRFLHSDASEVPPSLRQLARLLQSQEATAATTQAVSAIVKGVAGGLRQDAPGSSSSTAAAAAGNQQQQQQGGALDQVLEAVLSERGQSLVALAVSMGARNLVGGYLEAQHLLAASSSRAPRPDATDRVLAFLARPEGQQLVGLATSVFISHGMRVYMDESLEVNLYEDIFSSMAKPQHLEAVKACIGTFAREAVGAAVGGGRSQVVQQQERQAHVRPAVTPRLPTTIQELPRAELMGEQSADAQVPTEQQQQDEQQEQQQGGAHSPTSSSGGCEPPGECTPSQHDDLDSDSLLHASSRQPREQAKGSPQPAGSPEGLTVGTPLACESPSRKPPHPAAATRSEQQLPSRTQQRAAGSSSGHAQWVSAVGSEWLKTVRDPNGRSVMVELAGAAAKETVHGLSSALAERFDASWFVLAAFAALLCSWLCLQLLQLFMR